MAKTETYMIVSDEDCTDAYSLREAQKEAERHFLEHDLEQVKIYKLIQIVKPITNYTYEDIK